MGGDHGDKAVDYRGLAGHFGCGVGGQLWVTGDGDLGRSDRLCDAVWFGILVLWSSGYKSRPEQRKDSGLPGPF